MKKNLLIPNGVVFFCDESHPNVIVPFHDDGAPVAANNSCVSVITMHEVDGEALIELDAKIAAPKKENFQLVFEGVLETPGRLVSMSTSQEDRVLEVSVQGTSAKLSIWLDNLKWPETVLVEAQ